MACQVSLDGGGVIRANRTKDQIEIEILELPTEAEGPSRTERLRSKGRFLAFRKAFLDPARVPPGTPITRIGVVKGSTTRRLDEGVNDRSRHVSDLDSCTGNSWNCTSNAEPRVQRTIALGIGMGRFYGAKFEGHSLSRKTWESDSTPDIHRQGGQTPYLTGQATF